MLSTENSFSVTMLKGVGPKVAEALARLGIITISDLLFHLPFRYEDRTRITLISSLKIGDRVLVEGQLVHTQITGARKYLRCTIQDNDGSRLDLVFFHFAKGHQRKLSELKKMVRCFGEVRQRFAGGLEIVHPEYTFVQHIRQDSSLALTDCLSPIYLTTKGLHQFTLRKLIKQCVDLLDHDFSLPELLPKKFLQSFHEIELRDALRFIHFPPANVDQAQLLSGEHPAGQRLFFEELLAHQLSLKMLRKQWRALSAAALPVSQIFQKKFLENLSFSLTCAQQKTINEITHDLSQSIPMLRLIQGDVGSGKTVVACMAALQAIEAGYQVAVMVPTEILSLQHYHTFCHWLSPFDITTCHLTGKQTISEQNKIKAQIASGAVKLIIGTHALFQQSVFFKNLALLIIDEQHRFGVHQRLALMKKGMQLNAHPHQLIMTATPIPRTLAMSVYAELDCSIIDELPPGRQPITTLLISNERRKEVIERVNVNCSQGKQAYWICPLVLESEILQCQAAEETIKLLQFLLPHLRIGLIHSHLKSDEKNAVMRDFQSGNIELLVATTVVEVGVDIPKAILMVIENSERFGLAQLHQLRGRIGRGSEASYCVLLYQNPLSSAAKERLSILRNTQDGFEIAKKDLEIRGPGEVFGVKQSGTFSLRIADFVRDNNLLFQAQLVSEQILIEFPDAARLLVKRWFKEQIKYIHA